MTTNNLDRATRFSIPTNDIVETRALLGGEQQLVSFRLDDVSVRTFFFGMDESPFVTPVTARATEAFQ